MQNQRSKNLIFIIFHHFQSIASKTFMKTFLILNDIHFLIKTKKNEKKKKNLYLWQPIMHFGEPQKETLHL